MFPISFPHNRFEQDKSRKIEMVLVCLKNGGMCNPKKRQKVLAGVFVTLFPCIDDFHFERKDLNSHMYQL